MPFTTAGELIAAKRQPLVSVEPGATARAALRVMEEKNIGFLPVLDGEKLVGVVSERDIASGVILQHRTAVREIMTTRVHTVAPETKLPECVMLYAPRAHPPSSGGEPRSRARRAFGAGPDGLAHRAARAPAAQAARRARGAALPLPEQLLSMRP